MMSVDKNISYGFRLAIIYSIVWFGELLDATLLNVALPEIAKYFLIDSTNGEWALIGFLFATVIGMLMSSPASTYFGSKRIFLTASPCENKETHLIYTLPPFALEDYSKEELFLSEYEKNLAKRKS